MNHVKDLPSRLLAAAVRLLPRHRQDWARAMRAELAAVALPADRWRFAIGCARTVMTRPTALARMGGWILAAAVVSWALILANNIGQTAVRGDALAMVLVLAGVSWIARSRVLFGSSGHRLAQAIRCAGFVLVATLMLTTLNGLRVSTRVNNDVHVLVLVWTTILVAYAVALTRVTADTSTIDRRTLAVGTMAGLTGGFGWLAIVVLAPTAARTNGMAILVMTVAAVASARLVAYRGNISGRQVIVAGLWSLAVTASLVGLAIDILLPAFSGWVSNSSPPVYTVAATAPTRLVDSIAVWLLGMLCAAALVIAIRPFRPRTVATEALSERNSAMG